MGSGQIRETQRISTVNPRRRVAEAPSAGAQTPRTQAISTVCAKRGAAQGDHSLSAFVGMDHSPPCSTQFTGMQKDDGRRGVLEGSMPTAPTQRISTVNPRRRVAEAPSAGARTGLTQGIPSVCAK